MSDISISSIQRSTNEFSFIDTLGSFINNYEFKRGYDQLKLSNDNKSSYMWSVLSVIGGDYANVIYENVLNYIDNVANVDLCKVKCLRSMMQVLGVDIDMLDVLSQMPVEVVNLVDILSVNKKYILDSKTFTSQFHDIIMKYDYGKCVVASLSNDMSSELSCAQKLNDKASIYGASEDMLDVHLSDYSTQEWHLDNDGYKTLLVDIFKQLIESNVYMQYADAENSLSTTHTYIYQYIADKLLAKDNTDSDSSDSYDQQIQQLKTKYRLHQFKQDEVMDAIEAGTDYFSKYNQYEQQILSAEQKRRAATYQYVKSYAQSEDSAKGYSLTRHSWYREQKVIQYFKFVQSMYSKLLNSSSNDVMSVLKGTSNIKISAYDIDNDYFVIGQTSDSSLLYYDKTSGSPEYRIRSTFINVIAQMLAQLVLDIADIREQVKIQHRKSYMKGTFLLLSYVINEYLKNVISKNYGAVIYTQDENIPLSSFIDDCIKNNGVELVEYTDVTEYFNISSSSDLCAQAELGLSILNIGKANDKFYDNDESKVGHVTQDIPLAEIDDFYRNQLNLKARDVQTSSDLVNFLSLIYDYGVNESFLADRSDDMSSVFKLSGEFYCKAWNDSLAKSQWLGDIDTTYALYQSQLDIATSCKERLESQKAEDYEEDVMSISAYLSSLSTWWHDTISADNNSNRTQAQQQQQDGLYEVNQTSADMMQVSSDFQSLYNDSSYETYFKLQPSRFSLGDVDTSSMSSTLSSFSARCKTTGICTLFINDDIMSSVPSLCNSYMQLDAQLQKMISGYVNEEGYWPYYFTKQSDEITSQTHALASYLQEQLTQIESEQKQHFQSHLDALLTYKNEMLTYVADCNNAYELFNAMYSTADNDMAAFTGTHLTDYYDVKFNYWVGWYAKIKEQDAWTMSKYIASSPAIPRSPIVNALDGIKQRCSLATTVGTTQSPHYLALPPDDRSIDKVNAYDNASNTKFKYLYNDGLATQIKQTLSTMTANFTQVHKRIEAELCCLNVESWKCNSETPTVDNVGSQFTSRLSELLSVINELDVNYVKTGHIVSSDKLVSVQNAKISRAKYILSSAPSDNKQSYYNIKKVTDEYDSILEEYDTVKDKHRDYLSEYADAKDGKLHKQFAQLLQWSQQHDVDCQEEVLSQMSSIIAEYAGLDDSFKEFASALGRQYVKSVDASQLYSLSSEHFKDSCPQFRDILLEHLLPEVKSWLDEALKKFDETADAQIYDAIEDVEDFAKEMQLQQQLQVLLQQNDLHDIDGKTLPEVIALLIDELQQKLSFVESKRDFYNIQKEIFLKYNGTEVGYDPFYNFKNVTHSSYQIHPYLYNFVESNNVIYPLANTFFAAFTEDYEQQLVQTELDNIIGKYGNIVNLSKYGMLDWTGYQSQLERDFSSESDVNLKTLPAQFAYAGAFYPPALEEFLADPQTFIQKVQDNTPDSYYYKLNLSQEELNKISEQLRIYEKPIREIVRCPRDAKLRDNMLSAEYDIYKYTQDIYGNSLVLFKSYKHLYKQNASVKSYTPSYNEKKNTPGELWMRIKSHPIAFPAFDLRESANELTQYYVTDDATDVHKMNRYVKIANDYFSSSSNFSGSVGGVELADVTADAIQACYADANQHMRCFFDMELTPDKRQLLLVVPMQTGTAAKRGKQDWSTFIYGNTNVIIGQLWQDYDYMKDMNVYAFQTANIKDDVENVTNNVDNIRPSKDLLTASDVPSTGYTREVCEFIGFAKHSNYIIAVYACKFWYSQKKMLKSFTSPSKKNAKPLMQLECWCYNGTRKRSIVATQELKHDILYKEGDDYKYANTLAVTSNDDIITVCYISEEFQRAYFPKAGSREKKYTEDTTIVNFAEYTNVVDNSSLTAFGENMKYPSDTAMLQTTDAQHINIYNSFDSFTSYVIAVDFKFVGSRIVAKQMRHYNLNSDCGYYPLFADAHGKSRMYANSALSSKSEYSFQLLGPENSDVDYTPVILDTNVQEQNGRVTEDYRDYNKLVAFSEQISAAPGILSTVVTFDLRKVIVDDNGRSTYDDLAETGSLVKYKWNIANTSYAAMPVARGTLSQPEPTDYYYLSSSMYDMLSGQEMFGPNGITFQGTTNTNHIDGISAIDVEVLNDVDSMPSAIQMTLKLDGRYDMSGGIVIPDSKFQLLLYAKNSSITYDYYRIIENAYSRSLSSSSALAKMLREDADEISFKDVTVLSDFEIDGKFPFRNISSESSYKQMVAPYMFKYSEEDAIDREFPLLAASDVNDEVIYIANEDQYIYFFAIDGHDTVDKDIFYMEKYDVSTSSYVKVKVNTVSTKYKDFYDRALTIETTYNVEEVDGKYGIVLYFNYKNFTQPSYVNFKKRYTVDGTPQPPEWSICTSTSKQLENTYLRLMPGKSGRLDIRVDYVEYAKVSNTDIMQSIVGKETRVICSYYIMNVSDDKPKFIISRQPFK